MHASIISIGSANTEKIIVIDQIKTGSKSICKHVEESFGGSAINWGVRLRSEKIEEIDDVYVACPLGGDNRGEYIRKKLVNMGIKVIPELPLSESKETNYSYIITCGDNRTVYTQRGSALETWAMKLAENIETEIPSDKPLIAMIGNIDKSNDINGDALQITENVIEALSKKKTIYIYANFGRSQYSFCYHHWKKVWNKIDFFQLNVEEAREFFSKSFDCQECRKILYNKNAELQPNLSLYNILKFFKALDITAIITLAGSGSVAVTRGDNNVIFTWPRQPTKNRDTTGSGDAFGAGVIWSLLVYGEIKKVRDYALAFSAGSVWGASACSEYGGHRGIPDTSDLFRALSKKTFKDYPSIYRSIDKAEPLLYMLDKKKYYYELL